MSTGQVPEASQARTSTILAGILGMLALTMVTLRLIQRSIFNRQFGYDDGLNLAALVCATPLNRVMFPVSITLPSPNCLILT